MNDDRLRWLDRIAHDLRGPLMPLQTAAYLLKQPREPLDGARQQELADIIDRQSRRLARMLEEFGDWSRAQQQRLVGQRARCELATLLDLAIGAVPGCTIEPQLTPGCADACIEGDQFRLVQALRSLIDYSHARDPAASVEADVDLKCDQPRIQLIIRDRGELLEADAAAALVTQPESAPGDGGLGLRLLVARAIIEAHGGTLQVRTIDGLVFECMFPVAAPRHA